MQWKVIYRILLSDLVFVMINVHRWINIECNKNSTRKSILSAVASVLNC